MAEAVRDMTLGGIRRTADLLAEFHVTPDGSVLRCLTDVDVEFMYPLPAHKLFEVTRTVHAPW